MLQGHYAAVCLDEFVLGQDEVAARTAEHVGRLVRAGPGSAHGGGDLGLPAHAQVFQEGESLGRVVAQDFDELRLAHIVAVHVGLQLVQIRGVEHLIAAGGDVGVQVLADGLLPALHGVALGLQGQFFLNGLDAGGGHGAGLLDIAACRVEGAACGDGIAAHGGHLFHDEHAAAGPQRFHGGGHARATRADDYHVSRLGLQFSRLLGGDFLGDHLFGGAGGQQGRLDRLNEATAGIGASGHGIHGYALMFQD